MRMTQLQTNAHVTHPLQDRSPLDTSIAFRHPTRQGHRVTGLWHVAALQDDLHPVVNCDT